MTDDLPSGGERRGPDSWLDVGGLDRGYARSAAEEAADRLAATGMAAPHHHGDAGGESPAGALYVANGTGRAGTRFEVARRGQRGGSGNGTLAQIRRTEYGWEVRRRPSA